MQLLVLQALGLQIFLEVRKCVYGDIAQFVTDRSVAARINNGIQELLQRVETACAAVR